MGLIEPEQKPRAEAGIKWKRLSRLNRALGSREDHDQAMIDEMRATLPESVQHVRFHEITRWIKSKHYVRPEKKI